MNNELATKHEALLAYIGELESCLVAFSAGVDSTVVAKAAQLALGDRAIAITADSPSLAAGELEQARELAELIGIRHHVVATTEFTSNEYTRNHTDRCYHCKSELYSRMDDLLEQFGIKTLLNGANLDDQGDYRPGMQAAREHQVLSPLLVCGFTKEDVRALADHWKLPVWDKPAAPCLSSRIAYGEEVTPQRVAMVDSAEQVLRQFGLNEVRVRYHKDDMARIEAPLEWLPKLCEEGVRETLVSQLKTIGFKFVSIDLEGFRSGSLNVVVPIESLKLGTS